MLNKHFDILRQFLGDYERRIYGRQLIGKISLSQKGIALVLTELEKSDILTSKIEGRQKYYMLNKKNPLLKLSLVQAETIRAEKFFSKHAKINLALRKIDGKVVCIFGSYARGLEKETSDIDLFVIGGRKKQIEAAAEKYGLNISPKLYTEEQFVSALKNKGPLLSEIVSNHIMARGAEFFIESAWRLYYGIKY